MTKRIAIGVGLTVLALAALASWVRFGAFWKVDTCLDSGGAWNYSAKSCQP
jgi:hypothetical protein